MAYKLTALILIDFSQYTSQQAEPKTQLLNLRWKAERECRREDFRENKGSGFWTAYWKFWMVKFLWRSIVVRGKADWICNFEKFITAVSFCNGFWTVRFLKCKFKTFSYLFTATKNLLCNRKKTFWELFGNYFMNNMWVICNNS